MLTRIGNKVTVGRPLCNVLRIGRPLEGGGSFLRDWTVFGKSEVVGSSVLGVGDVYPWNQLVQSTAIRTASGISQTYDAATGLMKINGTATADGIFYGISSYGAVGTSLPSNHKGLFTTRFVSGSFSGTTGASSAVSTAYTGLTCAFSNGLGYYEGMNTVTNSQYFLMRFKTGDTFNDFTYKVQMFDLTAIFGSGNEPSTVDEFKAWLVKVGKMAKVTDDIPYFPYDAGSTFASLPIVASSRNLWDEEWEVGDIGTNTGQNTAASDRIRCKNYISVIPGKSYYLHNGGGGTGARLLTYDENYNYISSSWWSNASVYTAGTGVAYIRFRIDPNYGTTYNHNICINISDVLDGTYTPHQSQRFPLVISSPLHGIGDVRDIMRYSDHGITRKLGVVDMGTLTWRRDAAYSGHFRFSAALADIVIAEDASFVANVMCYGYQAASPNTTYSYPTHIDKCISNNINQPRVMVVDDAYTDAAAFKAAMQGVLLVYELATPTFEPVALPKLPAYKDGTVLYTDTQVHGDTIAGEAPVGFSLLPPVTMTPPTGDEDTNGQTDDTATE